METYKRTINLRDFGLTYDGSTSKDFVVQDCNEFLPHREDENIQWGTLNHYLGWLRNFISEADIYKSVKRFDEFVLINARENDTEYLNADTYEGQKTVLAGWLANGIGVYSTEYEAKNAVIEDNCGGILFVHPDAETFKEMFSDCQTAARFLDCPKNGSEQQYINLPVYIASDVEDLGMYEVYDAEQAANGTGWDDIAEYLARFGNVEVSRVIAQEDTLYAESQLNTLQRSKKEYDEDGNVLPYLFNEITGNNELPYVIGLPCNVIYSNESFLCNVLESVKYYNEGSDTPVAVNEMYPNTIPDNGIIEFIYLVNAEISGDTVGGGVEYRERRRYTVEGVSNGRAIIIGDDTLDVPENYEEGVQYAIVDKIDGEAVDYVYRETHLFKNDAFMNIQDSKIVVDDVHIDRGTSAAYEAFNVLGETNTIEDIENYRDDWFRIRGKND